MYYKLLSFFAVLAVVFAAPAPAPEPAAEPGVFISPALPQLAYSQLGLNYPAAHIAYSAPLAYPSYSAYPAPLAYNKIY